MIINVRRSDCGDSVWPRSGCRFIVKLSHLKAHSVRGEQLNLLSSSQSETLAKDHMIVCSAIGYHRATMELF